MGVAPLTTPVGGAARWADRPLGAAHRAPAAWYKPETLVAEAAGARRGGPAMLTFDFQNLAPWDRGLRLALGVAMLWAGSAGMVPGVAGVGLRVFSWWPLVTGLLGWCPVYALFDFGTRRR